MRLIELILLGLIGLTGVVWLCGWGCVVMWLGLCGYVVGGVGL